MNKYIGYLQIYWVFTNVKNIKNGEERGDWGEEGLVPSFPNNKIELPFNEIKR